MSKKYEAEVINKIKGLQEQIARTRLLNEDLKLCKAILPDQSPWIDSEINYSFTCTAMSEVKIILGKFARAGIMIDKFIPSETNPIWYLKGKNCRIRFSPYWSQDEGATCRLVQVGTETREYPKFKLVCKEASGKEVTKEYEQE